MLSATIDRTGLSEAPLVIGNTAGTSGFWIPEDGLGRPAKAWRRSTVTSPFTHGNVTTRAVLEQATIELSVYAQAETTAALRTLQDELEDAVFQWSYAVTITEDGQARAFTCDPGDVSWGQVDSGMTAAHLARATVTIPCYPVGA